MNKYYTQINVKLSTSQVQTGDNANYIRLMSKMMVERIFSDAIKNIIFKFKTKSKNIYRKGR